MALEHLLMLGRVERRIGPLRQADHDSIRIELGQQVLERVP